MVVTSVEGTYVVKIRQEGRSTYAVHGFGAPIFEQMRLVALIIVVEISDTDVDAVKGCTILIDRENG